MPDSENIEGPSKEQLEAETEQSRPRRRHECLKLACGMHAGKTSTDTEVVATAEKFWTNKKGLDTHLTP